MNQKLAWNSVVWCINHRHSHCIPVRKSGILRIQYGHAAAAAAAAAAEISFGRDNLKNISVSTFKFGMWVYMGNATKAIFW